MFSNKRSALRSNCNIPLLMSWETPELYQETVASNISSGGMCLKSNHYLSHNKPLYIKSISPESKKTPMDAGEAYMAKVRWIKKRRRNITFFDVGLQYMSQCTFKNHLTDRIKSLPCDMCGCRIEANLHKTHEDLHLCANCFWQLGVMDQGVTQSSITRFLSGNVF